MWLVVFSGNGAPSIITAQLTATVMTDQCKMALGYHQENEKRNDRKRWCWSYLRDRRVAAPAKQHAWRNNPHSGFYRQGKMVTLHGFLWAVIMA